MHRPPVQILREVPGYRLATGDTLTRYFPLTGGKRIRVWAFRESGSLDGIVLVEGLDYRHRATPVPGT